MGDSAKRLLGDDETALGIIQMGPAQRASYMRGMFVRGDGQITANEYAALRLAEEMDNIPGRPSMYGKTGRRRIDAQLPDDVVTRFRKNQQNPPTKIALSPTEDLMVSPLAAALGR